ncbi:hypothetical protein [Pseudoflavitalea rhizosphaerae]|uniref:hypothetical protein n=1 Tax=Pseudoflavitalea rhizosphaerae TaxID=1884793 RepID=UPI000F8E03CB|nr:hypothetical protein [Pseudoflavitalea rhizosphaerae]
MFTNINSRVAMLLLLSITFFSCKKEEKLPGTASLTVVNMVRGVQTMVANFGGTAPLTYYATAPFLYYNTFTYYQNRFSSTSGAQNIGFFSMPDTSDKSKPVLICNVDLPVASINSLFLIGTVEQPDNLFIRDEVPYIPLTDSSGGFRFVNVLANSGAVSVNIKDKAPGSLISSLAYKGVSDFIKLPVKPGVTGYTFEFRDAGTGSLIFSYTTPYMDVYQPGEVNFWMWRSNTMVLSGDRTGTGANGPAVVRTYNF